MSSLEELGLAVKRLQWRHHREGDRRLSSGAGLSLVQWDVLRRVQREPGASQRELASATFQTDQSMGELARRMVTAGLLRRVDGPGRTVRHEATPEGLVALEAGSEIFLGVLQESVGRLDDAEQRQLLDLLRRAAED